MTKFGITYIGYSKDEFGYLVKFSVRGTDYEYEMPFFWAEKIEQIARHSEPKALNMAKEQGTLVTKELREEKEKNTRKRRFPNETPIEKESNSIQVGRDFEGRPKTGPGSKAIHSPNGDRPRPNVAEAVPSKAILKARRLMSRARDEGNAGRDKL